MIPFSLILIGGIALEVMIVVGLLLLARHARQTIIDINTDHQPKDEPQ